MKNRILKLMADICLLTFVLAVCCLDSDGFIPLTVVIVTGLWLTAFAYANHWFV